MEGHQNFEIIQKILNKFEPFGQFGCLTYWSNDL